MHAVCMVCAGACANGWMDGWMDGGMDGWREGGRDEWIGRDMYMDETGT